MSVIVKSKPPHFYLFCQNCGALSEYTKWDIRLFAATEDEPAYSYVFCPTATNGCGARVPLLQGYDVESDPDLS